MVGIATMALPEKALGDDCFVEEWNQIIAQNKQLLKQLETLRSMCSAEGILLRKKIIAINDQGASLDRTMSSQCQQINARKIAQDERFQAWNKDTLNNCLAQGVPLKEAEIAAQQKAAYEKALKEMAARDKEFEADEARRIQEREQRAPPPVNEIPNQNPFAAAPAKVARSDSNKSAKVAQPPSGTAGGTERRAAEARQQQIEAENARRAAEARQQQIEAQSARRAETAVKPKDAACNGEVTSNGCVPESSPPPPPPINVTIGGNSAPTPSQQNQAANGGNPTLGCNLSTQEIAGCINVPPSGGGFPGPGRGANYSSQQQAPHQQRQTPGFAITIPAPPSSPLFPGPGDGADYGSQQQVPGWETSASGIRSLPISPPTKTNCSDLLAYMTKVGTQIHGFPTKLAAALTAASGASCAVPTLRTCLKARLTGQSPPPGCPSNDVAISDDGTGDDPNGEGPANGGTTADLPKDMPRTGGCDEGPALPGFGATDEQMIQWERCKSQNRQKSLLQKLLDEPDPYCQLIAGQILEHGTTLTGGELTPPWGDMGAQTGPIPERCRESADTARKLFADSHKVPPEPNSN